jgi:tetratricopeptide (TPR) repeat protein
MWKLKFYAGNNPYQGFKSLALGIAFCFCLGYPTIAATNNNNQNQIPTEFPPSPLEITPPDPLLPRKPTRRQPLTESERETLLTALDRLNSEASAKLKTGDQVGAFEIWYRELRLRRFLGFVPEVQALGRVGAIAWQQNRRDDVQIITKRLQTIDREAQKKPPVELPLLRSLGIAYQQVRSPQAAANAYEQILAAARSQQDAAVEEATLLTLADLHRSYFEYIKTAAIYRELLKIVEGRGDRVGQVYYLKQLAYIYDQAKQHQLAIQTKQQLIQLFNNEQDFALIPGIQLAIGDNYAALGLLERAAETYQAAYAFAYERQMFARAGEALQRLANLFQTNNQTSQALEVYQLILQVSAQAGDLYALMSTYDEIGKIYLDSKELPQALIQFEKGLEIAKRLQYREAYFTQRITEISQQVTR